MIGAHFSPQLAIKGFHGAAGWISFCILCCLVLFAADRMAWFHRGPAKTVPAGFRSDSMAAEVVPFIVLLISSLAATASFLEPERAYPMRLAAMSVALLAFAPVLRNTRWSFAPGAALAGIAIAVAWLAVKAGSPARSISDILGQVTPAEANFWVACRVLGTTIVIPIIEELFFRGYLMRRLDFGGKLGQATALLLSSTLFGALHEGFLLAAASGLVLAFVRFHRDRIADAIVAHATANATIAAFACWSGNWAVI